MPNQAPLRSVTIGDKTVTFLPDGGGTLAPTALFPVSSAEGWQSYPSLLDDDGNFVTSVGGFLIKAGDKLIAVDTGFGALRVDFPGFGPLIGGDYHKSFSATGHQREDVTDVIFTHLHLDHVGWTTIEGDGRRELMYPNARYWCAQTEWEFWHGGDSPIGPHPEFVQKPLENLIQFVQDGDEIAPGIKVVSTPGHTPGHLSLVVDGGEAGRIFLTADVFHGVSQLTESDWAVAFDNDPVLARTTREALYTQLTQPNTLCAINHFSNEVFGHITPAGERYAWQPLS